MHVENQLGSKGALEGGWDKALKNWCFYWTPTNTKLIKKILLQVLGKKTDF